MLPRTRLVVCLLVGLVASPIAQEPALRTSTTAIMFDVVVRDGKGRPLVDLDLSEIELVEDGKPQTVTALFPPGGRVLPGAGRTSPSPDAPTGTPPPPVVTGTSKAATPPHDEAPSAVAFVFDQLSPEARALAARVADRLLAAMPQGDWVGVFGLGHSLYVAQSFTRDREAAKTGLARMAQRPMGAESAGGGQDFATQQRPLQGSGPEVLLHAMEMRMSQTYALYTLDDHGINAAVGLRAVAEPMAGLRGRKAIVLFSEGIPVTDRARTLFDTMVGTANRAGVTFYTVDAAGLRAESALTAITREQDSAGRVALGDAARPQGAWTRDLENQAMLVRSGGTASLARLAKETGGMLLEHTNSVERIARHIAEDQAAHYLLAYTPTKGEMDGSYRRVTVRVRRKGAAATHRSGYWAVAITP